MRHSVNELIDVARSYYPRGVAREEVRYKESLEHQRMVAARRQAGADDQQWRALLRRAGQQFPSDNVHNDSLHLPTGAMDAAYSGKLFVKASTEDLTIAFLVSFVVPYYLLYSHRVVVDPEREAAPRAQFRMIFEGDTCYFLPAETDGPEVQDEQPTKPMRRVVCFDFPGADERYAAWLAQDIEATWGYERMPPDIGRVVVPDVATDKREIGTATLYDCLFSDDCPLFGD